MFAADTYRIRFAAPEDLDALKRLAELDSGRPTVGRALIGYLDGVPAAVFFLTMAGCWSIGRAVRTISWPTSVSGPLAFGPTRSRAHYASVSWTGFPPHSARGCPGHQQRGREMTTSRTSCCLPLLDGPDGRTSLTSLHTTVNRKEDTVSPNLLQRPQAQKLAEFRFRTTAQTMRGLRP
jgi:hypothetical protein